MRFDTSTEFGRRVAGRLAEDEVLWLTTVGVDGTPQPSPVWFLWDGETVLVYSQPNTPKVRNIERGGRASANFNSTPGGEDVVVLTGDAWIDPAGPAADAVPAYIAKYAGGLAGLKLTPEAFAADYSVAVRLRPANMRGF